MPSDKKTHDQLIAKARAGDREALGRLLDRYRNYLGILSQAQVADGLKRLIEPSDVVQEVFIDAWRDFSKFYGSTENELLAWLRKILARNLVDQTRRHEALARDWRRKESLEELIERSSSSVHKALAKGISSPSQRAIKKERAVLLADALARLPEDYREVLTLRHLLQLKFDEVAVRMGRSTVAVRILWTRALEKLRQASREA